MATVTSGLPQPVTGFAAALVALALVIFLLPPKGRIWAAALALSILFFYRGRNVSGAIERFRKSVYGG